MKTSICSAIFLDDIQKVWSIVTDNKNYTWRSDISKIKVSSDGKEFTEYTKNGFETNFIITVKEPYSRYEFDMINKNMRGHWSGIFSETSHGTQIIFTEKVQVKNPIMNLFLGFYLKKQQNQYIRDLRTALNDSK